MTTLYKYRIYCVTDSKYEYVWDTDEPTTCPTNTSHTINADLSVIVDTIEKNIVQIQEETTPTGGHYCIAMSKIDAKANTTSYYDWSKPYPISALSFVFYTSTDNIGDSIKLEIAPNTTIGVITGNVTPSDNVISVNSTVTDNVDVGYYVKIFDASDNNSLGQVTNVDAKNGTISVTQYPTSSFLASSPSYINMSVCMLENVEISNPGRYIFGEDKIGGAYIPANTIVRTSYTNNSSDDKTFIGYASFIY